MSKMFLSTGSKTEYKKPVLNARFFFEKKNKKGQPVSRKPKEKMVKFRLKRHPNLRLCGTREKRNSDNERMGGGKNKKPAHNPKKNPQGKRNKKKKMAKERGGTTVSNNDVLQGHCKWKTIGGREKYRRPNSKDMNWGGSMTGSRTGQGNPKKKWELKLKKKDQKGDTKK